jgi:bla regulator protein blaR1
MILYLLKVILCQALLLLVYVAILEKEKMYRFNRAYLLASLLISFGIPIITFTTKTTIPQAEQVFNAPPTGFTAITEVAADVPLPTTNWSIVVAGLVYATITSLLFYRFIKNIIRLACVVRKNTTRNYKGAKLVLTQDNKVPHSFLNYIFLEKAAFEQNSIEDEILCHELTHVRQKHSLDILFTELLITFFWFNPVLFFYRKSIQLNHEFLADEQVIKSFNNPHTYQYMLLQKASQASGLSLSSPFNYSLTKKRLLMMTRNTSTNKAILKQLAMLPVLAGVIFTFSSRIMAQTDTAKAVPQKQIESTTEGVSQAMLDEYQGIIDKYKEPERQFPMSRFFVRITPADQGRMEVIFKKMSKKQQDDQKYIFRPPFAPLARSVPSNEQFEAFKNSNVYGVWINDKRVSNNTLNKYDNIDFAQFDVSKLYGAAKKGRTYSYQVNMMTKEYYQKYYNQAISNTKLMLWVNFKKRTKDADTK